MQEKRLPTPQGIRALREQLRTSTDPDEQETVQELLDRARERVEAAIPQEALAILAQVPPALLECYALLGQKIVSAASMASPTEQREEQTQRPTRHIAQKSRSVTIGDMEEDGLQITVTAEDAEEQAYVDAFAGLANQGRKPSQVQRGQSLYAPPPVTDIMQLDNFQGAYKGYVEETSGKGKRAKKTTRTIAVHKAVYEDELTRAGSAVSNPSYWLPKLNAMTIYFPGEAHEVEVAWLLGDYDPQYTGVPAGTDPTPEQIVQWMEDALDGEEWEIEVIKRHLRTSEQKAWMDQHDVSISDVLNGRTLAGLDVTGMLFDDWNAKLGVKMFGF